MSRFSPTIRRALLVLMAAALVTFAVPGTAIASGVTTTPGSLPDGATYLIQMPDPWNGTLLLYSHGYVTPGSPNPAHDVGDPLTGSYLLQHGYALAGSSYATTGWALQQAIPDQLATLDAFETLYRVPDRTIAWGHSLGGIITAALLQTAPDRFTAALPMCGVLAGGVGTWNQGLDAEFAIQQLLPGGSSLQIARISNPGANLGHAEGVVAAAQATASGRARLALASALGDLPGWFTTGSPEPAATDYTSQEANQFQWITQVDAPFLFALRAELEFRAGGNPSWNTGVNYAKQLEMSTDFAEVTALYQAAGLDLDTDLATLASAARTSADPSAVDYLTQWISFNGDLSGKPVLTMHTTGDGLVVDTDEQAYRSVVQDAKDSQLLRQAYVHRAGHCAFTPAETIAALQALTRRIDSGKWTGAADPGSLNAAATALGSGLNVLPPSFIDFSPAPFLRPSDLGSH